MQTLQAGWKSTGDAGRSSTLHQENVSPCLQSLAAPSKVEANGYSSQVRSGGLGRLSGQAVARLSSTAFCARVSGRSPPGILSSCDAAMSSAISGNMFANRMYRCGPLSGCTHPQVRLLNIESQRTTDDDSVWPLSRGAAPDRLTSQWTMENPYPAWLRSKMVLEMVAW